MSITHLKYWTFELNPNSKPLNALIAYLEKCFFFKIEEESNSRFNLLQIGPWTFWSLDPLSKKWP
jgi:hypothetical protein